MALSGSVTSSNGYTDEYGTRRLTFSWTATQNIANNTSTINWTLSTSGGYPYWIYYSKTKVVIDGVTVYYVEGKQQISPGTITSGTVTLTHNSVGDRSFSASVQAGIYEHAVNCSASGTWTLDNIPRASTVTAAGMQFGVAGTLNISRAAAGFTDGIHWMFGSQHGSIVADESPTSAATVSWTPPTSLMTEIPNATSGEVQIIVHTFSNGTMIASRTSLITVSVPSSVVPTASVSRSNTVNTFGVYAQGISKCRVQTSASGAYGSTISSITTTIDGASYTGADITSNVLSNAGNITVTTVVKDSRGRSVTKTGTITVSAYTTPAIDFSVHRCDSLGNADEMGSYAKVWIHATGTAIGSGADANEVTPTLKMRQVGVSTWTDVDVTGDTTVNTDTDKEVDAVISAADTYSWEFQATVADAVSSITQVVTISVGYATIDFLKGGRGIAFGTTALTTGFKCAMDALYSGELHVASSGKEVPLEETFGTAFAVTWESGVTAPAVDNFCRFYPATGLCVVNFSITRSTSIPANSHTLIGTLPSGMRPTGSVYTAGTGGVSGWAQIWLKSDGSINIYTPTATTAMRGTIIFTVDPTTYL